MRLSATSRILKDKKEREREMRNNLQALNDALFEQIERIQDDQLTEEELGKEHR